MCGAVLLVAGCGGSRTSAGRRPVYTLGQIEAAFLLEAIPLQRQPVSTPHLVVLTDPALQGAWGYQHVGPPPSVTQFLVFVGDGPHSAKRGNVVVTYGKRSEKDVRAALRRLPVMAGQAYTSLPWTKGHSTRLRYCQPPGGPGNYVAASAGVTCRTAVRVEQALTGRCYVHRSCDAASFRCVSYYAGQFGARFETAHHALCRDGSRRVEWDGG